MPQPSNGSFTMFPDVGVRNQVKICGCGTWSANRKILNLGYCDKQNFTLCCWML
jgi:hypothetical protein